MSKRSLGIGTAVVAVTLAAGVAVAQRAETPDGQAQTRIGAQGPQGRGQMRGRLGIGQMQRPGGRWQIGPGQGRGRGGFGPGQGMGPGRGGPGMLAARLDLTDDQQTKIEALHRGTRDQAAAIQEELALTRSTLHRETFADARDDAKIGELAAKVTTLEKQLFDLHLKTQTGVADVLTAEQREKMRAAGDGPRGRGRGPGRR